MPRSASSVSPGPFTRQPITAIVMSCSFAYSVISLDVLREVDERLVLHARARRATDDVHALVLEARHGAEAAVLDVVEDLPADGDLVALALERKSERDADRVADAARDELLECDARLDHAVRRHARLGHAEMQRHIGTLRREEDVRIDDFVRVGVLERDAVLIEAEIVEHRAVFERGLDHRRDGVVLRILVELLRIDRAGVHADAHRAAVRARDVDEVAHFFLHRLVALEVVEMTGVVTQLLDVRRDLLGQPVVLLKVDDEIRVRARLADLGERGDVLRIVDGDADDVGAGRLEQLDLADGGGDVLRARGGHRLHGDRIRPADADVSDANFAGFSLRHDVANAPYRQRFRGNRLH